jgi:hypothetical protein
MGVAVKLHRCGNQWVKIKAHPCWNVESALQQAGVEYERVPGPFRRKNRTALQALTGQTLFPAIEFEDGTIYRAESKEMAARIRAGELGSSAAGPVSASST